MAFESSSDLDRGSLGRMAWINVAATLVAAAVMTGTAWHLPWPNPSDSAVAAAGARVVLVLSAVVTLVVAILTAIQRRRRTWAIAAWLLVAGCALGVSAVGRPTFGDHQSEFEEVARQLLREPENSQSGRYHRDLRIGRFDVAYAHVSTDGSVYFYDARTGPSPSENPGWIYAPHGLSETSVEHTGARNIGGGWYTFPNLVVDNY
ncbi:MULTISPECIES: hypothetical protein [Rhodococcus]|uniref:DUF1109 domain-containing protein n=1 Tax=Rhodococcus parequi TaxID=3137122 RepID=A0ABW9F9Z3_9NOCA